MYSRKLDSRISVVDQKETRITCSGDWGAIGSYCRTHIRCSQVLRNSAPHSRSWVHSYGSGLAVESQSSEVYVVKEGHGRRMQRQNLATRAAVQISKPVSQRMRMPAIRALFRRPAAVHRAQHPAQPRPAHHTALVPERRARRTAGNLILALAVHGLLPYDGVQPL